jgi:hypothetical protein
MLQQVMKLTKFVSQLLILWSVLLIISGCASMQPKKVYETPGELQIRLESDVRTLNSIRPHLEVLDDDFTTLRNQGGWVKRGYFSEAEDERIELLLFRFITSHTALWNISAAYQDMKIALNDSLFDAKAHVLSQQASLLLAKHSAFVVEEFANDPIAIAKMNEAFYRSEIPRDSYYELARGITAKRLSRLKKSGVLTARQLAKSDSKLSRLASSDTTYRQLIEINKNLQIEAETRMNEALKTMTASTPEAIRKTDEFFEDELYAIRSMLFKDVSRLKNPTAKVIRFSNQQKAKVYEQLLPGDLILTYTAGYISDVFIPGAFKHGITFVGLPHQRIQAGLNPKELPAVAPDAHEQIEAHILLATLDNGKQADMIEAVAEGVIFNNLSYILDTHVNRLLVLRPQLTAAERTDFLIEIFSYLGDGYDFRFDFADSTRQVCTEVIYRGIQGKGGISFDLTVRGGHETLSADDIVLYYLNSNPESFNFVLYAEENPKGKNHEALILTGSEGIQRLQELMANVGEEPVNR